MIPEILKQFNWVDIFVIVLLFRIIYISSKTGAIIELFKLLGIYFSLYITLHYYVDLSDLLRKSLPVEAFPTNFFDFIVFLPLLIVSYLVFVLLRSVFCNFVKIEAVPTVSKIAGFLLGVCRGILTISLVIYIFAISCMPYLFNSAQRSFLGKRLFNITVVTYTGTWDNFASKFMTQEKLNNTVVEAQKNFLNEAD